MAGWGNPPVGTILMETRDHGGYSCETEWRCVSCGFVAVVRRDACTTYGPTGGCPLCAETLWPAEADAHRTWVPLGPPAADAGMGIL